MPYVNDAQTLSDVVGPASAADALQTQQAQAQQEMAIKNQVAAGQAPADIQRPGLQNALTQAQTYGQQGLGMQENAKGLQDMFAAPSGAQAQVAGNQLKMTSDQAQKIGQIGQMAGQAAAYMDNVPPPGRPAAMAQLLQKNGIDPSQLGPLASGDPQMLRQAASAMAQSSQQFIQQSALESQKGQIQQGVANTEATSRQGVASTMAGSREAVAQTNAAVRQSLAPVQAIVGQLTAKAAAGTATPQELAILKWAQSSQQLIHSGDPFQSGITGTNTQSNVPDVPNVGGSGGQNGTQQPPAVPDQNAIEAEMKRRGLLK